MTDNYKAMIPQSMPLPAKELERLFSLSEFDIDYIHVENNFKDLTLLAAKIAHTEISLINLIDTFNQWTISNYGLNISQMPREDSVCQYTIVQNDHFEISDLSSDDRFKDKSYVSGAPNLRYYFGIPLTTSEGLNIGALCVLDKQLRKLEPEKIELLKIVAKEVVHRLQALKVIEKLKTELNIASEIRKKAAHDIRGPISGIIGLSEIILQEDQHETKDILECAALIHKSGISVLDLAEEILNEDKVRLFKADLFNLVIFKNKIEDLYLPQAKHKHITFKVFITGETSHVLIYKSKLLQIAGNLVSNAIKFTPVQGKVTVYLELFTGQDLNTLKIRVTDSGNGLDETVINNIINGDISSSEGTIGEKGYGYGLSLVRHLVEVLNGKLDIRSNKGEGTTFEVTLIQSQQI